MRSSGNMWFFDTHATELRIYSKRLCTSMKRIKSQHSSGDLLCFFVVSYTVYTFAVQV